MPFDPSPANNNPTPPEDWQALPAGEALDRQHDQANMALRGGIGALGVAGLFLSGGWVALALGGVAYGALMGVRHVVMNQKADEILAPFIAHAAANPVPADIAAMTADLAQRAGLSETPIICLGLPEQAGPQAEMLDCGAATFSINGRHVLIIGQTMAETISMRELRGVIAHEVSHMHGNDSANQSNTALALPILRLNAWITAGRAVFGKANLGQVAAASGSAIAARVTQSIISRSDEKHADAFAAELTRDPLALKSALEKIVKLMRARAEEPEMKSAMWLRELDMVGKISPSHPNLKQRFAQLEGIAATMADALPAVPSDAAPAMAKRPRPTGDDAGNAGDFTAFARQSLASADIASLLARPVANPTASAPQAYATAPQLRLG